MWIILGFCVLGALAIGFLRHRANRDWNAESTALRRNWRDFDEKAKWDRAKGPYHSTHQRPPWDGSKSGEHEVRPR